MRICKQCGGEITNKFCENFCVRCIERAMDTLTADDIMSAMTDLAARGKAIAIVNADGSRSRVDPSDFYKSSKDN